MGLTVLDNQFRIKIANDDFFKALQKSSVKSEKGKVLFQIYKDKKLEYFYSNTTIYILKALGFWFSRIEKDFRYIYVFGVDEPKEKDSNIPICAIDFSTTGTNKEASAVFAQDMHGNVSALYRVNQEHLKLNSFELEFGGEWIQAFERDKNNYFILIGKLNDQSFLGTFKDFLIEIEHNLIESKSGATAEEEKYSESQTSFKSCLLCGKVIKSAKSNYESLINDLGIENSGYCVDCLENIAATTALKKIDKEISLKFFNKKSLFERVDEPDVFESYLDFLVELGYFKEINKGLYVFNRKQNIDELFKKYMKHDKTSIEHDTKSMKKCVKCGVVLTSKNSYKSKSSSKGFSDMCKDCSRNSYAVTALNNLEKYVVPGVVFSKDDLLKQVDNRTMFLDYIWTLQEFDLLEKEGVSEFYILKPEEDLIKFKEKYGDEIKESESVTTSKDIVTSKEKKPTKKVVKECELCNQILPISKFYKSSISDDGYSEKCKDCSRKSYAAKGLVEFKNYVISDIEFYKEDLLKQAENRTQLLDYFWTLQEFDFIEHNEKTDTYILKPETEINVFLQKYGEQIKEPSPEVKLTGEEKKAVKKCKTCEQTLPISNFYKSSESSDGHTENCKKCSDMINTANILSEIKKYMGIGNPFSKKELSNQLGNPTKVNYYIWTLQEHNLINHNEKKDTYTVEDSPNYKDYEALLEQLDSSKTLTISVDSDKELIKKDIAKDSIEKGIVYISESTDTNIILILRGIIPRNDLYSILEDLKELITINMTNMTLNTVDGGMLKLIVELELENKSYDETLKLLKEKKWKNYIK